MSLKFRITGVVASQSRREGKELGEIQQEETCKKECLVNKYLLITEFKGRTAIYGLCFSPSIYVSIGHIQDNRHFGFDFILQISHVVCQGANIKMMLFLRKSTGLNSEVSVPKSHLRAKM